MIIANNRFPENVQVTDSKIYEKSEQELIADSFKEFLDEKTFPCVAARAALNKNQISIFVAEHMACPKDDVSILEFVYNFVERFRTADSQFYSACVIFKGPVPIQPELFDMLLWMRLNALINLDKIKYNHDPRVANSPESSNYSFSLKEEAFYVVGLNPSSARAARKFSYPALVFNPHAQFEMLRANHTYDKMKNIVRKRDIAFSGSVNPTLHDFGESSEVYQYSGLQHDTDWKCPLNFHNT